LGLSSHLTRDEKRTIFRAFIERIEVTPRGHFESTLRIVWRDGSFDSVDIGTQRTNYQWWSEKEVSELVSLYNGGATQLEIAQRFSTRKWIYIQEKTERLFTQKISLATMPMRVYETYLDYEAREDKSHGRVWTSMEVERLRWLVVNNALQVEIAKEFPGFTWFQINRKIYRTFGAGFLNFEPNMIKRAETYSDYLRRVEGNAKAKHDIEVMSESYTDEVGTFKDMSSEFESGC